MWAALEKLSEHVKRYSTILGQIWYICVFIFRLIVVSTIGGAVYGDEQSKFVCSTLSPGCENMCFNSFSKISHMRFWAFQLLGVLAPTVFFHFYATRVTGQIEKLKQESKTLDPKARRNSEKKLKDVKIKTVYYGEDVKQLPLTMKIHLAYYFTVLSRLVVEGFFIYLAHLLFRFEDPTSNNNGMSAFNNFLVFKVPGMFKCTQHDPGVFEACRQHFLHGKGYVACWSSRPQEKTIFIQYMNVFSAICFILSLLELVYLTYKGILGRKCRKRTLSRRAQKYTVTETPTSCCMTPLHNEHFNFVTKQGIERSSDIRENDVHNRGDGWAPNGKAPNGGPPVTEWFIGSDRYVSPTWDRRRGRRRTQYI